MRPLEGVLVLDFSQFLAGPSAAMRLADLGARVIKIERPVTGELGRSLYSSRLNIDGDGALFHAINRNKEGVTADLKNEDHRARVRSLIKKADVMIQNFRPGVMERLGFGYKAVHDLNPRIVYAEVSGYGTQGPWADKPGQDLLAQAVSGITWLSGNADDPPTAVGAAIADVTAGNHLTQGILACLLRRCATDQGGHVEVSLLESTLDLQFDLFATFLNDRTREPVRSRVGNANAYLAAPYGIYATTDGYIAISMVDVSELGKALQDSRLEELRDSAGWYTNRDEIQSLVAEAVRTRSNDQVLAVLESAGLWSAPVLSWRELIQTEHYRTLDMTQTVRRGNKNIEVTRSPIRIDGELLKSEKAAPYLGEHAADIWEEERE